MKINEQMKHQRRTLGFLRSQSIICLNKKSTGNKQKSPQFTTDGNKTIVINTETTVRTLSFPV